MNINVTFLHIPKTGCTCIKYALEKHDNVTIRVHPKRGHKTHIRSLGANIAIITRDPWQRFCSGFWERRTMPERREISKTMDVKSYGYMEWRPNEQQIFQQCKTPEEFFVWAHRNDKLYNQADILSEITGSITKWLGSADTFHANEHKLSIAFDIKNLTPIMKTQFGIDLPEDPFLKRSRELFNIEQSYDISPKNLELFQEWRSEDYKILEHIRKQHYYITQ